MSPCFKALWEHHCFMGAWIYLSKPTINVYLTLARAIQQFSYVSLLSASSGASNSAEPSMVYLLPWRSWVVWRIRVHRVIVLLILAPCRARGSATAVRRILVISPESSLHAHRVVLVFARAKMPAHLPLVCSTKRPPGKPQASFPQFPSHREIS